MLDTQKVMRRPQQVAMVVLYELADALEANGVESITVAELRATLDRIEL